LPAIPMVDDDHIPITMIIPPCINDHTIIHCVNSVAC
jgi:hypothetical protein